MDSETVAQCAVRGLCSLCLAVGAAGTDMCCLVRYCLVLVRVEVPVKDGVEGGMCKKGVAYVCGRMADEFGPCNGGEVGVGMFH